MSQITVENIKRASETVARSTRGVAAAWVNFNGTGTAVVRDSLNVSSLTDNSTGDFVANLTSAMANADFAFSGHAAAGPLGVTYSRRAYRPAYRTTTTYGAASLYPSSLTGSGAFFDADDVDYQIHGDLA